jgi:hypothetical protein
LASKIFVPEHAMPSASGQGAAFLNKKGQGAASMIFDN